MSRTLRDRVVAAYRAARSRRLWRAVRWYVYWRGTILCGGIAYAALFSLFASLTIGYTVATRVLGDHPDAVDSLFGEINAVLPGLIDTGDGSGGVIRPEQLLLHASSSTGLNLAGVVAAVVLLYSVISFMSALRRSVRLMFGGSLDEEKAIVVGGRMILVIVAILVAVLVGAVAMAIESRIGPQVMALFGLQDVSRLLAGVIGVVATITIDTIVVFLVVRVLAGVTTPRRDLLIGCLAAGCAMAALRYLGSSVISASAQRNVLVASFATLVTILIVVNLMARILLLSCAWMANPPEVPRHQAGRAPGLVTDRALASPQAKGPGTVPL